jgi:hypothetical protein
MVPKRPRNSWDEMDTSIGMAFLYNTFCLNFRLGCLEDQNTKKLCYTFTNLPFKFTGKLEKVFYQQTGKKLVIAQPQFGAC